MRVREPHPADADPSGGGRVQFLESIRGLAALQVVLLHLFSAFVPALVFGTAGVGAVIHHSPLFYVYGGYSAVYLFFALSGYVLTKPFTRDADRPLAVIGARWARLALPAVAACLVAVAIMAIWPAAHVRVGHLVGSAWLADLWRPPPGVLQFVHDAFLDAPLAGYREAGALAELGQQQRAGLQPIGVAYVAPLWTLSVEFAGSLLVLGLAAARHAGARGWLAAVGFSAILLCRTPYFCFVIGHCVAVMGGARKPGRVPAALCIAGFAAGVFLCVGAEGHVLPQVGSLCRMTTALLLPCDDAVHFQKTIGALLVFLSLTEWEAARRLLSDRRLAALGRLSFPIYLVHWPIVFGFGCFVYLAALPAGPGPAAAAALVAAFLATLLAAAAFTHVDRAAQKLSHIVRDLGAKRAEPSPVRISQ